jgi:hypothetical protein
MQTLESTTSTGTSTGMCAPIAFLVFNGPGVTRKILAAIERAQPARPKSTCLAESAGSQGNWCRDHSVSVDSPIARIAVAQGRVKGLIWADLHPDDCRSTLAVFRYCTALLDKYHEGRRVVSRASHERTPFRGVTIPTLLLCGVGQHGVIAGPSTSSPVRLASSALAPMGPPTQWLSRTGGRSLPLLNIKVVKSDVP